MGDTLGPFRFEVVGFDRPESAGVAVVARAQQEALKTDLGEAAGTLPERHRVSRKRFANGAQSALPFDLAVVANLSHHPAARIADASPRNTQHVPPNAKRRGPHGPRLS